MDLLLLSLERLSNTIKLEVLEKGGTHIHSCCVTRKQSGIAKSCSGNHHRLGKKEKHRKQS